MLKSTKVARPAQLRKNVVPGAVLIILSGSFAGKRVVFLKQLESGLLLVSGPMNVNGVPLRRVNQSNIIATRTTVDISKVDVAAINDAFFARSEEVTAERKAAQKAVDAVLGEAIKAVPHMKEYLSVPFSLQHGDRPHAMKF